MGGGPVPIWKKYTSRPRGFWEKVRQLLALVPNRSTGNPVPSLYRKIPPGERIEDANRYGNPVTLPAGGIKGIKFHERDFRRNYPQVIGFNQTKVSGLLSLGSAEKPRIASGEEGSKQVSFYSAENEVSLPNTLTSLDSSVVKGEVLGPQGEPLVAPSLRKFNWTILQEPEHGMYSNKYPCRMFTDAKVKTQ